ncbi:hypothetical protein ABT336_14510 [Micromonospora sp. NPDC000207]|uniref:hypothetical protein n=1 Tax=Micromonospora sp. NPDC000207 TaxID=3154246 RepID=UPI0033325E56
MNTAQPIELYPSDLLIGFVAWLAVTLVAVGLSLWLLPPASEPERTETTETPDGGPRFTPGVVRVPAVRRPDTTAVMPAAREVHRG